MMFIGAGSRVALWMDYVLRVLCPSVLQGSCSVYNAKLQALNCKLNTNNSILGSMKDSSILLQDSKDLTEKERALGKRINEIKQQNKAIVMRGREIEKDKKLYG